MKTNKNNRPNRAAHVSTRQSERLGPLTYVRGSAPPLGKYVLRLFVAGATARSRQAVLYVRQLCEAELKDNCVLEVIDIYQQPHLARINQIVATPTLIKELPRPVRRFIGNLLNIAALFVDSNAIVKR